MAYQCHHWHHSQRRLPGLRWAIRSVQLTALRLVRQPGRGGAERCPEWELRLVKQVAFNKQLQKERRRPRAYDRRGLVKLSPGSGNAEAVR